MQGLDALLHFAAIYFFSKMVGDYWQIEIFHCPRVQENICIKIMPKLISFKLDLLQQKKRTGYYY